MQISRKALYAIRALICIASSKGEKLSTITEIAEKEGIPREYMAKILKELAEKGLLISYRGVNGGYKLKKPLEEISFLDILEVVQGKFDKTEDGSDIARLYKGAAYDFWRDLHDIVKTKLADMRLNKIDFDRFYYSEAVGIN